MNCDCAYKLFPDEGPCREFQAAVLWRGPDVCIWCGHDLDCHDIEVQDRERERDAEIGDD